MPLAVGLWDSHQNGGRVFLIFVADPITVRWYSSAIADCEHPARFGKLWRRAELSGGSGSPNTVGDGTHLITLAPHDKRPDIEDTRRRSD